MSRLKVFISYSSKDGYFAGIFKDCLEKCVGFEGFLAHDDLKVSDDWPTEVLKNLNSSDLFVALISPNFLLSSFANQEVGIAMEKKMGIIPISIDGTNPPGFLNKIHAYKCSGKDDYDTVEYEIMRAISEIYFLPIRHPKYQHLRDRAINCMIDALNRSNHFRKTSLIINVIIQTHKIKKFSAKQLRVMITAIKKNPQVHNANLLMPKIIVFLREEYRMEIDI